MRQEPSSGRRAIFLDRDGTLNLDTGYVSSPRDVKLLAGAAEGTKRLADAGYALIITSNQSGIARGLLSEAQADDVDRRLLSLLRARGVAIEAVYRCPHLPDGSVAELAIECDCRKPKPGLFLRAAADLKLDLRSSWAIGDSPRDVEAGLAAGCRAILLEKSGAGDEHRPKVRIAKNLIEAAGIILSAP
jgi:D-glycero-D-manno-heptose 1,7-bisphosphate phosphatase